MANNTYDYGFKFNRMKKPNTTFSKWFMVLNHLCKGTATKEEIWERIDAKGYNNPNLIGRRGWNSNVFTALAKEGYIEYSRKTRKWSITDKGKELWLNSIESWKN